MATKPTNKTAAPPPATAGVPEVPNSALANAPPVALSKSSAPAWLVAKTAETNGPRGLEKADSNDLIYPRLVLGQSMSPVVKAGDAAEGDIFLNITGDVLAPKGSKLTFIPVVLTKTRLYMKKDGSILCRSADTITAQPGGVGKDAGGVATNNCADCVNKEFDQSGDETAKPLCTQYYNVMGILPEHGNMAVVLSMKSTGVKVMRKLLTVCKQTGFDFWAHKFDLFAVDAQGQGQTFAQWDFSSHSEIWANPEEYAAGEALYNAIVGKDWRPDVSDIASAESGEESTDFPTEPATPAAQPAAPKAAAGPAKVPQTVTGSVVPTAPKVAPPKAAPADPGDGF